MIRQIQAAVGAGVIQPVDPDLTAHSLTGQIEIMSLGLSLDAQYTIEDIIDYIVKGIRRGPGSMAGKRLFT